MHLSWNKYIKIKMNFNLKLILTLLVIIPNIIADVNGGCSGRNGICISTDKCSNYGGETFSGKCPSDPNDIKCCDNIPCTADDGRKGTCAFSDQCNGEKISGKCPGGSDFKCCIGNINKSSSGSSKGSTHKGGKPSWYINQGEHRETICTIGGERKSVASSGCGVASLAMAIGALNKNKVTPETLFREGYKSNLYHGDGFSHASLTFLGKKHGVSVKWTDNVSNVYSALESGKGVIFHVGPESKYHFTKHGHYIFLFGCKKENGVEKVYVFDPNGHNNYVNKLFPLRKSQGGIEKAKRGQGGDFGIVS